ncbi:jumonji superfamily protein [Crepidotus variabilis]|uniref:JmjC domain-containing histone demethylation protein 1 n=1 Tax=Crepidotus variabilis TaxID=179855 RepID=A0A9P6JTX8_9AGAR|nr:jumonji superfamily protein [Crepidotus variabilis]
MAPKRRSTRKAPKSPSPVPVPAEEVPQAAPEDAAISQPNQESCPACTPETRELMESSRKESWIECDSCNTWYHWRCAGNGEDVDNIAKWYCADCTKADSSRVVTLKAPTRKSSRKRTQRDYASLDSGIGSDPNRWLRLMEKKAIKKDPFKRMKGNELDSWLEDDETAFREPIVIEDPEGLGMKMPPEGLTVEHVAEYIGEDQPVEVVDVASQSSSPGWNLGKWADYIELEPSKRDKILNVISLEISGTELANMILPPKFVRDLDWVENFWPGTKKNKQNNYPKVQLYCLMGVANAWTDWHIDFAGSSVYYHIHHGSKVFYFIRPTPANLAAYEKWSGSELQYTTWLGDMCDDVYKVELVQGNTMIIPSGWIHAVHTPVDTLVFGGNFLHSYDVPTQLRVREIEIATQVPKKFRFPLFSKLCWYVCDKYLRDLKSAAGVSLPTRVLNGIVALSEFLVSEARILETGSDQAKKETKEQIPSDRIKDAPAVARELRWRAKQALGCQSDDEGAVRPIQRAGSLSLAGTKRRRLDDREETPSHFRNFKPKLWDAIVTSQPEESQRVSKTPRPHEGDEWTKAYTGSDDAAQLSIDEEMEEANVSSRKEVVVKVRRTAKGLERHRIERTVEEWRWDS